MKKLPLLLFISGVLLFAFIPVRAQDPQPTPDPAQQPTQEELDKQKTELTKSAYRLLDEVVNEAQSLHLVDNRIRVQISAGDIFWDQNSARARSLFMQAADEIGELVRSTDTNSRPGNQLRRPAQLRQQLVLIVARHDAQLAYQLLAATKAPTVPTPTTADLRNPRGQFNTEDNLEQSLLSQVAALDPKFAAQNADQMLDKGQFPRSVGDVIAQLQRQDKDAAAKLMDKTLKKLQSANLLSTFDAVNLSMNLLSAGPKLPGSSTSTPDSTTTVQASSQQTARTAVLEQSAYNDLLSTVIDNALKATPQAQLNQRGQMNQRGRGPNAPGNASTQAALTDAQIEQAGARRLLSGLQPLLPQIDQNLPARAQSVRQKLSEMGMGDSARVNMVQAFAVMQQDNATTEAIMQAASTAPPQLQPRMYQQAAFKALDAGNIDQARQIATDHLQDNARDTVLQRIDLQEMARKSENGRIDDIRLSLSRIPAEKDRIDLLLQMSNDLKKSNPKLGLQLLEEAKQIADHRATDYDHFEQQLKVAHAFASVAPARSFEVIEPGINQLNDLLSAAAVLNGFETNVLRDGELPLQGGSGLTATVSRFGEELAFLARSDFGRAESLAGRFQSAETRTLARLSIVQGLLGVQPTVAPGQNFIRTFGPNAFVRDN